jgi:hypothetical protein
MFSGLSFKTPAYMNIHENGSRTRSISKKPACDYRRLFLFQNPQNNETRTENDETFQKDESNQISQNSKNHDSSQIQSKTPIHYIQKVDDSTELEVGKPYMFTDSITL